MQFTGRVVSTMTRYLGIRWTGADFQGGTMTVLDELTEPIVAAPMAGGGSTPELAAAVSNAGGLGFLAAGYLSADAVRDQLTRIRALTDRPFGLNLFVPERTRVDQAAVAEYAARLAAEATRYGVPLGDPV